MTCAETLLIVYRAYVARTRKRVKLIECATSCPAEIAQLSDDERRNEAETYAALFSNECRSFLVELYERSMHAMHGRPFAECEEALSALVFLQEVVAKALWRHRCTVGNTLESFAREFDRLDVPAERERLYIVAQS